MKVFVYSYRTFDEDVYFQKFSKEYGIELGICHQGPSMENKKILGFRGENDLNQNDRIRPY